MKISFGLFYRVRVLRFFVVDLIRFNRRQLRMLLIVFRLKDVNVRGLDYNLTSMDYVFYC